MAKSERWRTCGRAALRGAIASIRAMEDRAFDAAFKVGPVANFTRDETRPEWVRAFALHEARETVGATEWNFRCSCPECAAEDAAGVGFGEPLDGVTRCERCREPAEYVSATVAEVVACGACRPAFDAEPENAGTVWYVI